VVFGSFVIQQFACNILSDCYKQTFSFFEGMRLCKNLEMRIAVLLGAAFVGASAVSAGIEPARSIFLLLFRRILLACPPRPHVVDVDVLYRNATQKCTSACACRGLLVRRGAKKSFHMHGAHSVVLPQDVATSGVLVCCLRCGEPRTRGVFVF
jgi:hypothetical protein